MSTAYCPRCYGALSKPDGTPTPWHDPAYGNNGATLCAMADEALDRPQVFGRRS